MYNSFLTIQNRMYELMYECITTTLCVRLSSPELCTRIK